MRRLVCRSAIELVCGHVGGDRCEATFAAIAGVAGDALAVVKQLNNGIRHAHLQYLPDQVVRDAVTVMLELDVVVDVR